MLNADEQIKRIEDKIQLLLKEYQQLQKELLRLQKDNLQLREALELKTKKSNDQAQTIDVLKIQSFTQNDTSKKELEKRINNYLKEIEKCLNLLQS